MLDQDSSGGGQIQLPRSIGIGVIIALGASIGGGVWYSSESAARIGELERRLGLEMAHLQKEQEQQDKRIDTLWNQLSLLDAHGSRGLDRVESRQKDVIEQLRGLTARLDKLDEQLRHLQSAKGGM